MEDIPGFEWFRIAVRSVLFYSPGSESNHRKDQATAVGERTFQSFIRTGI